MTAYCWCQDYRGPYGNATHSRGKRSPSGDCMYADSRDAVQREVVRSSFVRVSAGLAALAAQGVPLGPLGVHVRPAEATPEAPATVTVQCVHNEETETLVQQRAALIRMVEELLEMELPDVNTEYYSSQLRRIQGRGRGKARHPAAEEARQVLAAEGSE